MEKMVNEMLAAGLHVHFVSPNLIKVFADGAAFWTGRSIENAYETAKKKGYVK